MDAATISAFAATGAAVAAATVAAINFYVGYRQSKAALISAEAAHITAAAAGRRRIAEFRQAWIEKVLETFAEIQSLMLWKPEEDFKGSDSDHRLALLSARLDLLLNPDESLTREVSQMVSRSFRLDDFDQRRAALGEAATAMRTLLKAEWVRLQKELH